MAVNLTGLDPTLVRPAFQENPLAEPDPETDWCAFYIQDAEALNYPDVRHAPEDGGRDEVTDWIDQEARLYFYGPRADELAGLVRRGLHVERNRYALRKAGIAVRRLGNASRMPELVNGKWLNRVDLVIYITFAARGDYAVPNLRQSGGEIASDEIRGGEYFGGSYDTDGAGRP
jgi:hypothetical protein